MDFINKRKTVKELRMLEEAVFISYIGEVAFTVVQSKYVENNQLALRIFENDCWPVLCARCEMGKPADWSENEISQCGTRPLSTKYRPDMSELTKGQNLPLNRAEALVAFITKMKEFVLITDPITGKKEIKLAEALKSKVTLLDVTTKIKRDASPAVTPKPSPK